MRKLLYITFLLLIAILMYGAISSQWSQGKRTIGPIQWSFQAGNRVIAAPLVVEDRIVIQTFDEIAALDIQSGNLLWVRALKSDPDRKSFLHESNGTLLVYGADADVIALSAESGEMRWQTRPEANSWIEDAIVLDGVLYVARYNSSVTAYRLVDGKALWSRDAPNRSSLWLLPGKHILYLGTNESILGFDLDSGQELMTYPLKDLADDMVEKDGIVYISLLGGSGRLQLVALELENLIEVWRIDLSHLPLGEVSSMLVDHDMIFLSGKRLVALTTLDGQLAWVGDQQTSRAIPVEYQGNLYLQHASELISYERATGASRQFQIGGFETWIAAWTNREIEPVFVGQTIAITTNNKVRILGISAFGASSFEMPGNDSS